jgi:hypothetical protein
MATTANKTKENIQFWAAGCHLRPCVSGFIDTVSTILHRDYPNLKCKDFDQIYAWDADTYEKAKNKCRNCETVDLVFGLDKGKMLLAEAKLDVKNVDNLKGEIESKIRHTKEYLVSSDNFRCIASPSIVIFSQDNFNTKYNRFRKMRSNKGDIIPMTLTTLFDSYFKEK